MAVSYVWPGGLPREPRPGFKEDGGTLVVRTPMDAGPAKMRVRGNRPSLLSVSWLMTPAQVTTFETFVLETLKSTARFGFTHPRKRVQVEVRFVPSDGGKLYDIEYVSPTLWAVSAQLEVLP